MTVRRRKKNSPTLLSRRSEVLANVKMPNGEQSSVRRSHTDELQYKWSNVTLPKIHWLQRDWRQKWARCSASQARKIPVTQHLSNSCIIPYKPGLAITNSSFHKCCVLIVMDTRLHHPACCTAFGELHTQQEWRERHEARLHVHNDYQPKSITTDTFCSSDIKPLAAKLWCFTETQETPAEGVWLVHLVCQCFYVINTFILSSFYAFSSSLTLSASIYRYRWPHSCALKHTLSGLCPGE